MRPAGRPIGAGAGGGGSGSYTWSSSSGSSSAPSVPYAPVRSQHALSIRGQRVLFPYEPYPCQRIFIERLVEVLQNGQNALLESPTGTGKVRRSDNGRGQV